MVKSGRLRTRRRIREAPADRKKKEETRQVAGVLYDTDVLVEILRGNRSIVRKALNLERSGTPTYTSPISWAEISAHIQPGEEPITQSFLEARGEVVVDSTTGRLAGSYLARYAETDEVEIADALMAAAATTTGLCLWTLDRKHYPMPGIRFYEA